MAFFVVFYSALWYKLAMTTLVEQQGCIKENAILKAENATLRIEIAYLKEQLDWLKKQLFGQKAEKFVDTNSDEQLYFDGFDKIAPVEEKKLVKGHERSGRKATGQDKISFPADIPVERHFLELPEAEKVCQETGEPLVKIGEEVTSKLAHKPGSYFIKQIIRPKYAIS